jgi:endoglucanase
MKNAGWTIRGLMGAALLAAAPAHAFQIGQCINITNALNAPVEGEWGYVIEESHLRLIAEKGFDTIRVTINWAARADLNPPYTIDPAFFDRVDQVIAQARAAGLNTIIDLHNYNELNDDPQTHGPRAIALWEQIARHYRGAPDDLAFEPVNEPVGQLSGAVWQKLADEIYTAIRAIEPTRTIIMGGDDWNSIEGLMRYRVPRDRNFIATFHYYTPYNFTHQGGDWAPDMPPVGPGWGTLADHQQLNDDLLKVTLWSQENRTPIFLGEFGVFHKADEGERAEWTKAVRERAEAHGISWCYFDFTAGFDAYDRPTRRWRPWINDALGLSR